MRFCDNVISYSLNIHTYFTMADEALANKTFEMVSNKQSDEKEKKPRKARAPMSAEARERALENLRKRATQP